MTAIEKQAKEALLRKIEASDSIAEKCVLAIDNRQTDDEQIEGVTHYKNGIGFAVVDASFGSDLAYKIRCGVRMSPKQMFHVKRLARKYSGQITRDTRVTRILLQHN